MSKLIDNFIIVSTLKSTDEWEKHKGRNLLTKELVLIKTVKLERFNADTALKERVLNQIAVLKKIQSPAVLKLVKMLKSTHHLYLIYQFAADSVDTWQGSCTELLKSFVQAWREIARCGVVHGSLKPSAIRFEDRSIKVKNFECARVVTGQFIAPKSYAYSAPEVLGAQTISKSDVFSLGLIIYKLAYGKLPYSEEISFGELKEFWAKTTQIEIKQTAKIDSELMPILSAMLGKDVRNRCSWQQLWKLLQNEPGTPISRQYTLARSVEDCSPNRRRKQELYQQEQPPNPEGASKLVRLALEYGRRRNKLSLLASSLKELVAIQQPADDLQKIIGALLLLLKRYSSQLQQFVKQPSRTLSWVDAEAEKQWKTSELFQLCCQDEFEGLPTDPSCQLTEPELILELKSLQTADSDRRRIRYCIRQLSDLNLANNGVLSLRAAQNMFETESTGMESPTQLS